MSNIASYTMPHCQASAPGPTLPRDSAVAPGSEKDARDSAVRRSEAPDATPRSGGSGGGQQSDHDSGIAGEIPREHKQIIDEFLELVAGTEENGWTGFKETKGVIVSFKMNDQSPIKVARGKVRMPGTIAEMVERYKDHNLLTIVDPSCKSVTEIHEYSDCHQVIHGESYGNIMISKRDFLLERVTYQIDANTCLTIGWSIGEDHPHHVPTMRRAVRAEVPFSGYYSVCTGPNELETTYICQVDPKGWIPKWLVNKKAKSQAMNVGRARDFAIKVQKEKVNIIATAPKL